MELSSERVYKSCTGKATFVKKKKIPTYVALINLIGGATWGVAQLGVWNLKPKGTGLPLTTPPPKERSQFPISVLATIRGMVSGWDHPTASTAIAIWARGILSSRTRIWRNRIKAFNWCHFFPLVSYSWLGCSGRVVLFDKFFFFFFNLKEGQ